MKNKLELILIVDLLSRPGNFEHLHSSLLCQHTDISSVLGIVPTSSFQVQTSQDIGINNQALANLVICCDLNRRFMDSPSCEEVWSCQCENIWTNCGVSCQVNSLAAILLKVDFNFEFRGKFVSVLLVNKDMYFVASCMECSIWVFLTLKLENLGFFAKGHCSTEGQFKHFICILCSTLGGVCPHGLFVFLSLNNQTLSKSNIHNQFNGILCFSICLFQSKNIVFQLEKDFSCNFSSQYSIFGSCLKRMSMKIFLNLSINLDEFLVSLFQLNLNNIHISIFGSGNLSVDRLSQRSSFNGNAEDSIHLFEVQVPYLEGKVMLSLSIDDLNLCTLARNSVGLHLHLHVGDCSRDDGMGVRSGCGLDDGSPHITNMLALNHHLTLLFTITITVHHGVVNNHLE